MAQPVFQDIFDLKCVLRNISIKLCCRIENGKKKLLALLNNDGDILLHYTHGESRSVLKKITWYTDANKAIQAICFDPTATWLLTVSSDGTVHIIPALSLVDENQKVDCKWSIKDVTTFLKPSITPDCKPHCVVWWQTLDSNQNALLGYTNGAIVLISLTDGRCLGMCTVNEAISEMHFCHDNDYFDSILLITTESGQQYQLVLEERRIGYLWPPDISTMPTSADASAITTPPRLELHSLRQMCLKSFDSIHNLLTAEEASNYCARLNSQSSMESGESDVQPERLPHLYDTQFTPQYTADSSYYGMFYNSASLLTVYSTEWGPICTHKLPLKTNTVVLSDRLIYAINEDLNTLSVISKWKSERKCKEESEFNSEALLAQFSVCTLDEKILNIFISRNTTIPKKTIYKDDKKKNSKAYRFPTNNNLGMRLRTLIDTCILVTNKSIHKLVISISPAKKFVELVNNKLDINNADKLVTLFHLNRKQLLEFCGDLFFEKGKFRYGLYLYKEAGVHLLRRFIKLALTADCRTLLKFINMWLSQSKVDISMATQLHIGNLAVMSYTELLLRFGDNERITNTKDYTTFLCHQEFYDQILAVNIACQAGHWHIVNVLSTARGLQPNVLAAFAQVIQTSRTLRANDYDFLLALSDQGLAQSILIYPEDGSVLCGYIRKHVKGFNIDLLKRFAIQLDPSQPAMRSIMTRMWQQHHRRHAKDNTPIESTLDSYDNESLAPDNVAIVREVVETYILVFLYLIEKTCDKNYNAKLLDIQQPTSINAHSISPHSHHIPLPPVRPLSCGWEHTAVVRNGSVYCTGVARAGCLGVGPLLARCIPAKRLSVLSRLRVRAVSVACGRMHTVTLTDYGLYAWGGNTHGQLGVGINTLGSPYAQLVVALNGVRIVDVVAGQYHTVALSITGHVYTWGWGIHGQLGHGGCDNEFIPRLMDIDCRIVQIAAGYAHTIILTENGALYGFGSNLFGQLEPCKLNGATKTSHPVLIEHEKMTKIERISSGYFHNIAVCTDKVHVWGANPQEIYSYHARSNQQLSCFIPPFSTDQSTDISSNHDNTRQQQQKDDTIPTTYAITSGTSPATKQAILASRKEPWRDYVTVLERDNKGSLGVEDVGIGYSHTALLSGGQLMWGRSRDGELGTTKGVHRTAVPNMFGQKYIHVSCGGDYTIAMKHNGKIFAWDSNTIEKTLLGKQSSTSNSIPTDGKVAILKTTRRIIKLPLHQTSAISKNLTLSGSYGGSCPIELSGIPTLAITFSTTDPRLAIGDVAGCSPCSRGMENVGVKTLHQVLEKWNGLYNSEFVFAKCLEMRQTQACSKLALLSLQYSDSLTYQLTAFSEYINTYQLNFSPTTPIVAIDSKANGNTNTSNFDFTASTTHYTANLSCNSSILRSASNSSLDSLRIWGDDLGHQGGRESPCQNPNIGDSVRDYLQIANPDDQVKSVHQFEQNLVVDVDAAINGIKADTNTKELIKMAARIIEFYIEQTYTTENPILMQNILMKCLDFWLCNNLPVDILEVVLLKNMDKYFYPLSLLLFCKNFNNNLGEEISESGDDIKKTGKSAGGFLKEFSTKFCLHLCSMVLENVNKA